MPTKSIRKNYVSNVIIEQIKGNILKGEWQPGDKIPSENELKDLFGVSRNSVRAAIQQLTALGLLISRHGGGTFVSDLSPGMYMNSLIPMIMLGDDGLSEMLEFRKVIETESVKLAAIRATRADVEELEGLLESMNAMMGEKYDIRAFAVEDSRFHEVLVRCARNSVLMKVYLIIKEMLLSNQVEIQKLIGPHLAFKFHPAIVAAIKGKDPANASKIMGEHIQVTIDQTLERLQKTGVT